MIAYKGCLLYTSVKIVDAQNDPAKQANDISDLIESGVSVLIINPVDSAAISTSVEAANAKNIPVITVDRDVYKRQMPSLFQLQIKIK